MDFLFLIVHTWMTFSTPDITQFVDPDTTDSPVVVSFPIWGRRGVLQVLPHINIKLWGRMEIGMIKEMMMAI